MNALDGFFSLAALIAAKTTLLLVVAFALSFVARKSSASARHVLWALTFAFLLLIPGMASVSFVQQEMSLPVAVLSPTGTAPVIPSPLGESSSPLPPGAGREPASEPRIAGRPSTSLPWSVLAGSVWVLGTLLLILRLGIGLAASRRVRAESGPVTESDWIDPLDEGRERLGIRQSVALRRSDRVQLPLTLGLFRPVILLPRGADEYSISRRSSVILHELAHVRRRDCGSQLVSQLAAAAFWWNPLVWIACRHMRLLSERASDDLVLDTGARPSDYAHDLLEMARGLHRERATPLGSVSMAHRSRFEERLLAILDPRVARKAVSFRFVLAASLGAAPLVLSLALAVPTAATPPPRAVVAQAEEAEIPVPVEPASPAQEPDQPEQADQPKQPEEPQTAEERAAREIAKAALAGALDDPEASVREQALHALVQMGDDSVAPYLEKALADASPSARAQAAWGLGQMRLESSAASLVGALRDDEEEVREQAAWALGMIGAASSVEGLVGALSDGSDEVRSQAAWALGMIRDPRAVPGLNGAVRDAEENVREQVVWALGMIRSRESVDGLVTALSDAGPQVRSQAAWALGMIRDARAVEALSRALKDEDAEVREQAAWALGLILLGEDEDEDEREEDPEPLAARFSTGSIL